MRRYLVLLYAVANYLLFLAVFLLFAGFVGNLLPWSIDTPSRLSPPAALAVDFGLVLLFGLQHSVMARPGFKRVWTRFVPHEFERSTYLLLSSAALVLLIFAWQVLPALVWDVRNPPLRALLWTLFVLAWIGVPAVSLLINHFDLFGLRQAWLHLQGRPYTALPFRTPLVYRHVRHPLYVAWAAAFWITPTMSLGHLLLAALLTGYMALAVVFEERDLIAFHGQAYAEYARRVPRYFPRFRRPGQRPVLAQQNRS